MHISTKEAIVKANKLVKKYGTRNADRLANELGVIVKPLNFTKQKGVYKVIERNRYKKRLGSGYAQYRPSSRAWA